VAQFRGEAFTGHNVARTADLDEAHEAMENIFLPMRMRLVEHTGPLNMTLNAVRAGGFAIGYARFGRHVHIETVEARQYHVDIPLSGCAVERTGFKDPVQATPDTAAVFMPGLPAEIWWRDDCAQLCLMVPRQDLELELEKLLGRPLDRPVEFEPAMDLTTPAGCTWMDLLALVDRESQRPDGLLRHPLAVKNVESLLVHGLLLAQPHTYSEALAGAGRPARPRAVRQAIDLMHSQPSQPWSTADLARAVAVSARSLQEGFQRSVGMSPMAYLRHVRLNCVHQELSAAAPDVATVTRVATDWGFLHLGRFASAYREKFGQTPSQTLHS
jgi:AraC-like DNA-binding protein